MPRQHRQPTCRPQPVWHPEALEPTRAGSCCETRPSFPCSVCVKSHLIDITPRPAADSHQFISKLVRLPWEHQRSPCLSCVTSRWILWKGRAFWANLVDRLAENGGNLWKSSLLNYYNVGYRLVWGYRIVSTDSKIILYLWKWSRGTVLCPQDFGASFFVF